MKLTENNKNFCADCDYFTDEDTFGNGWCGLYDFDTRCDLFCDEFEEKDETVHN